MTKRVVSKKTKLLFIAFGAMGIAAVCVVYSGDVDRMLNGAPRVQHSPAASPAKTPTAQT
jgi:hypothetical protein